MRLNATVAFTLLLLQAPWLSASRQAEDVTVASLPMLDAASVRRNYLPDFTQPSNYRFTPGRLTVRNMTLRQLSQVAFSTATDGQLVGGPDWFDRTQFDIDATLPGASNDQLRRGLRRLLIERFALVARFDTRVLPVYKLVNTRRDGKLPPGLTASRCSAVDDQSKNTRSLCGRFAFGASSLSGHSVTMAAVAKTIAEFAAYTNVDRLVIDETGLTGTYTFTLSFSPEREHYGLRTARSPDLPAFPTALQEQLGLKLQPGKHEARVVVIEQARMPTAN